MNIALIISATVITISVAACFNNNKREEAASQFALPSFTVQNINGRSINLQSFKGKKVFVNLWASWCPPCRREIPSIEKLSQSVDTGKVVFIMLSLDDNFDKAKKFIQNQKLKLPVYYPAESLPELFNVQGIPVTFIFNENGELIKRIEGGR